MDTSDIIVDCLDLHADSRQWWALLVENMFGFGCLALHAYCKIIHLEVEKLTWLINPMITY